MQHDILGEIKRIEGDVFDGTAAIQFGPRSVRIGISCDGETFETALTLSEEAVRRLPELDRRAKRVASAELREVYNNGWNEYDQAQDDGSFKTISNPKLSEAEFEAKLSLDAMNVTGSGMIEFFYDDEKLFWGHSVVVHSMRGVDFSEARAELFG